MVKHFFTLLGHPTFPEYALGYQYDILPTGCPVCNRQVHPTEIAYSQTDDVLTMEFLCRCSLPGCGHIFIARYDFNAEMKKYVYRESLPRVHKKISFDEEKISISDFSPLFETIYNQAAAAETYGLTEIAGAGYRRALEFLVKDYLIKQEEKDPEMIKKKPLGKCIKEDIDDSSIKKRTSLATLLGNDETHYERRFEDKDIKDLKTLIDMSSRKIKDKILEKYYEKDMGGGK